MELTIESEVLGKKYSISIEVRNNVKNLADLVTMRTNLEYFNYSCNFDSLNEEKIIMIHIISIACFFSLYFMHLTVSVL